MYPYNLETNYNININNEKNSNINADVTETFNQSNKNIPLRPIEIMESVKTENNEKVSGNRPPNPVSNQYLLDMIKESLKDEATDAEYYGNLLNKTPSTEDKEIIRQIRMDELKHYKLFNDIYRKLTGEYLNIPADNKKISNNLAEEFEKNIFSELEGAEFYRKLLFAFLDLEIRDILFEIITDEQAHSQKMNYLYCKYK